MTLYDNLQFRISDGKVYVQTPQCGIEVEDFLQIMRRGLDSWRHRRDLGVHSLACSPNVNTLEECTT